MWRAGGQVIVEWLGAGTRGPVGFPVNVEFPGETQPTIEQVLQALSEAYQQFDQQMNELYPGKLRNYGAIVAVQLVFLTFSF